MQNKPNLLTAQINVNSFITKDYENKHNWALSENKANQTQLNPKQSQNKPKTKPIKPKTKPIKPI